MNLDHLQLFRMTFFCIMLHLHFYCVQGLPRRFAQALVIILIPMVQDPRIEKQINNARPACIPRLIPAPALIPERKKIFVLND